MSDRMRPPCPQGEVDPDARREGAVGVPRAGALVAIIGVDRDGRIALGDGARLANSAAFRGRRALIIGADLDSLVDRAAEVRWRQFGIWGLIRQDVILGERKTDQSRHGQFIFGQVILQRSQPGLLGLQLHLCAEGIERRGEPGLELILSALKERGSGIHFGAGFLYAGLVGDNLEVTRRDEQHHGVTGSFWVNSAARVSCPEARALFRS